MKLQSQGCTNAGASKRRVYGVRRAILRTGGAYWRSIGGPKKETDGRPRALLWPEDPLMEKPFYDEEFHS